jgi:hypothetical protein
MSWEETLQSWAQPPGQTQQEKCENAVRAVRTAIDASSVLSRRAINVFAQGSYRNRTNVRVESDVDICVLCSDVLFVDYSLSEGLTDAQVGLVDHPYTFAEFRSDVEKALRAHFGTSTVVRGDKAFDIHESSTRVDADVVACFEHRRYNRLAGGGFNYHSGTEFRTDAGKGIINWPDQNYDNGVSKNADTSQSFKAAVRMLKRLRNRMADEGIAAAIPVPSYLIECLVWNVPNDHLLYPTRLQDMRETLAFLFNNTRNSDHSREWGEINELKYLFRPSQPWQLTQTHAFVSAAWDYLGLE